MIYFYYFVFFGLAQTEYITSGDGKKLTIDTEVEITNEKIKNSGTIEFYTNIIVINAPSIASLAFYGCQNLVNIDLCASIKSIGSGAFKNCKCLESFTVPLGTIQILGETFYQCEKLHQINIHQYVAAIDSSSCFHGCTSLTVYNVSSSNEKFITDINMNYLMTKDGLTLLAGASGINKIPSSVQTLAQYSLYWRGVTSITFEADSNLKTIQKEAFGRVEMQTLSFPSKLERIEDDLFFQAVLDTIIFPDSVTYLADNFLDGITSINEIRFNNQTSQVLTDINGVIYNKAITKILMITSTATSITIPAETESIGAEQVRRNTILDVNVIKGNQYMSSYEGVLYDNETKKLIACPGGKLNVILAPTCTEISSESFVRCLVQTIDMNGCNLETIGLKAFNFCSHLLSMILPPSLSTIENFAFEQCNAWRGSIKLSSNLTTLGKTSFNRCQSVDEIDISECTQLTEIKGYTFQRCGLISIKLPSTIKIISEYAFYGASRLQKIELSTSTNQVGMRAFSGCTSLTECVINSPTITVLSEYLFESSGLTIFHVPDSITSIQSSCFQNCNKLASIIFGKKSKIETISPSMIFGCNSLNLIEIPSEKLIEIHLDAFANATNLQNIIIRDKLQHFEGYWSDNGILMKDWTLIACPGGRTNHTIDGRISQIASHAFYLCSKLESVIFTSDCILESIADSTFYGCSSLQVLRLPPRLKTVEGSAFNGCSKLTEVSLGNYSNVTSLGESCFLGCTSLNEFDFGIGSILESIKDSAFKNCKNLKLKNDMLPNSLSTIGVSSFEGCSELFLMSFPNNVSEIGIHAFRNCASLKSIVLPSTLSKIGEDSFEGCTKLSNVFFCGYSNIASNHNIFTKTDVHFVNVPINYQGEVFGSSLVAKVLDNECNIPTSGFTANTSGSLFTSVILMNAEVCDDV